MELIRQMLAVSAVLLLLAACLWWLRRKGLVRHSSGGSRKHALQAVERLTLGPQHSMHLVRLTNRGLLVGTSPAGCALMFRRLAHAAGLALFFQLAACAAPAASPESWLVSGKTGSLSSPMQIV